jgi:class 3 adenylate cyclase
MSSDPFGNYDDVHGLERFFNLPAGSLRNIPIYARKGVVDAIIKVRELENSTIFRPGLYYIVLADLCSNTAFNAAYGDVEGDVRTEWFHTAAIKSIGQIELRNYVAFSKTIGDAALMIFSSFQDVFQWSEAFSINLDGLSKEYRENLHIRGVSADDHPDFERMVQDFALRARRLVHLGEVSYKEEVEPLSLAVNQTFKMEKIFAETDLGCTQAVANAVTPKLHALGVQLFENQRITVPGIDGEVMTYYIRKSSR